MRVVVLGLLVALFPGCASTRICGAGTGPGGCYEPSTGKSTEPPTTTGNPKTTTISGAESPGRP